MNTPFLYSYRIIGSNHDYYVDYGLHHSSIWKFITHRLKIKSWETYKFPTNCHMLQPLPTSCSPEFRTKEEAQLFINDLIYKFQNDISTIDLN